MPSRVDGFLVYKTMADMYQQAKELDLNSGAQKAETFFPRMQGIFNEQRGDTSAFLNKFTTAINDQEPLTHMYDRIGRELNIPMLRENATQLRTTLNNIPYTYSGATRGFDVNANQLGRIVGTKSAELTPMVNAAEGALTSAEQTMSERLAAEQAQQEKLLRPYASEEAFLKDRLARETTGFTFAMESELNAYLDRLKNGIALNEGERERANQMAMAKLEYDKAIAVANIGANAQRDVANINKSANSRDPLRLFG